MAVEADLYGLTGVGATGQPIFEPISPTNPLPVNATVSVSASISGFTPNGNVAIPLAVTGTTARVALPAGASVLVSNPGSTAAYVRLGDVTVAATTSDIPVPAGGAVGLTVGANTYLAAITASSTTTINLAGGTGLFTGTGGTSAGGGVASTVTLAAGTAAVGTIAVSGTVPVSGTVAITGAIGGTVTLAAGAANVGTVAVGNFPATQPVSGTVTIAAGAATIGALALHQSVNLDQVGGAAVALGQAAMAASVPVVVASNQTAIPVSGTVAVSGTSAIGGTVTLAAGTAAVGTIAVSGTVPVSGTVTANLGALNGAATAANQTAVQGSVSGGTAGTVSELIGGVFNTSLPTLTNGQQGGVQLDASGRQIMGTSVANIGTVAVSGTSAISGTVAISGTPVVSGTVGISAGSATIGALVANQSINLNQIAGAAPGVGAGTEAAALRVTLPTNGTGVVNVINVLNTGFIIGTSTFFRNSATINGTTAATLVVPTASLSGYITDLVAIRTDVGTALATVVLTDAISTPVPLPPSGGAALPIGVPIKSNGTNTAITISSQAGITGTVVARGYFGT